MGQPESTTQIPWLHTVLRRRADADPGCWEADAKAVAELAAHPGWAVIEGVLTEQIDHIHQQMTSVQVLAQVEYVSFSRQVFALREALKAPEAVLVMAQRVRDEQERQAAAAQRAREQA